MIVRTDELWKYYGSNAALRGLNLSVPQGSAFAVVGPNGAGKSTALRILVNILQPSAGTAEAAAPAARREDPQPLARRAHEAGAHVRPCLSSGPSRAR